MVDGQRRNRARTLRANVARRRRDYHLSTYRRMGAAERSCATFALGSSCAVIREGSAVTKLSRQHHGKNRDSARWIKATCFYFIFLNAFDQDECNGSVRQHKRRTCREGPSACKWAPLPRARACMLAPEGIRACGMPSRIRTAGIASVSVLKA